jgi:hypothetical protein
MGQEEDINMGDSQHTHGSTTGTAGAGHESGDIRIRPLLLGLLGLIVLLAVAFLATGGFWSEYLSLERKTEAAIPPRFADETGQFPAPRNQPDPAGELHQLRTREAARLSAYGWVDPKAKIAHIPIDRAIELVTERGLPARKPKREEPKRP